jgi:thiaminase
LVDHKQPRDGNIKEIIVKHSLLGGATLGLLVALQGASSFPAQPAIAATNAPCPGDSRSAVIRQAKQLVDDLRRDLAPVEDEIRKSPYLAELESGRASRESLQALAGEQYNIIQSDLRSNALMVARFGSTQAGEFFRSFLEGEVQALGLLLDFAKALGLNEDDLNAYEPRPAAQTYPAYVASLALYGSTAEIAAAYLMNFPVFGENTARVSAALRKNYSLSAKDTAFFDFFAAPIPNFECNALAVIAADLERGVEPRLIKRAARLLQAYEQMFWDANAS